MINGLLMNYQTNEVTDSLVMYVQPQTQDFQGKTTLSIPYGLTVMCS